MINSRWCINNSHLFEQSFNLNCLYTMEKVIIIFPDNLKLSEFLAERKLSHAEAHSKHHSLIAPLSTQEIKAACKDFDGLQISFHYYQKSFR